MEKKNQNTYNFVEENLLMELTDKSIPLFSLAIYKGGDSFSKESCYKINATVLKASFVVEDCLKKYINDTRKFYSVVKNILVVMKNTLEVISAAVEDPDNENSYKFIERNELSNFVGVLYKLHFYLGGDNNLDRCFYRYNHLHEINAPTILLLQEARLITKRIIDEI